MEELDVWESPVGTFRMCHQQFIIIFQWLKLEDVFIRISHYEVDKYILTLFKNQPPWGSKKYLFELLSYKGKTKIVLKISIFSMRRSFS